MISEDAPLPPEGLLTPEEEEELTRLRQDRHDAAREERELLLRARARKPADYRVRFLGPRFEEVAKDMTPREREGLSLFTRDDLIRWGEICNRGHAAIMAQHALLEALYPRMQAIIDRSK